MSFSHISVDTDFWLHDVALEQDERAIRERLAERLGEPVTVQEEATWERVRRTMLLIRAVLAFDRNVGTPEQRNARLDSCEGRAYAGACL